MPVWQKQNAPLNNDIDSRFSTYFPPAFHALEANDRLLLLFQLRMAIQPTENHGKTRLTNFTPKLIQK
ncbi:MAG: hypothetical protein CMJ62_18985 [Planctomycetaceae bacterium]|nr:hypothetical protein [Planctomycetaceae bacterium]